MATTEAPDLASLENWNPNNPIVTGGFTFHQRKSSSNEAIGKLARVCDSFLDHPAEIISLWAYKDAYTLSPEEVPGLEDASPSLSLVFEHVDPTTRWFRHGRTPPPIEQLRPLLKPEFRKVRRSGEHGRQSLPPKARDLVTQALDETHNFALSKFG